MPDDSERTSLIRRAGIVAASLAFVVVASLGLRVAWTRFFPNTLARAGVAYERGDWTVSAGLAREILKGRPDDNEAQRLLARSSARLGRDEATLAIYNGRLPESAFQGEDYVLLGMALERRRRTDEAQRAWDKALDAGPMPPKTLEELARILLVRRRYEEASRAAERLSHEAGWEARGSMMLGTIRTSVNDVAGADEAFRRALARDPNEADHSRDPSSLRKLIARTFLRAGRPGEALTQLQATLAPGPDPEASWLLSRVYLQQGARDRAHDALAQAGRYRAQKPLEPEPSPYVGEARCEACHSTIFKDSLASRHTQSYYRGEQLKGLPRPAHPLLDPDDPKVTHAILERKGDLWEETRVGDRTYEALITYAFGTSDRYVTMVGRDARGGYRISRLSYYHTPEGQGWDKSALDAIHPVHGDEFQGEAVGMRDGVAKCLYCHTTNARAGEVRVGPETADRAIGCERCHGPGAHHVAAVAAGLRDLAIVNPAAATPQEASAAQCNDCHILAQNFRNENPEDPEWIRSQGVGWTLSRCNTESGGSFGCVTCHDPHKSTRTTTIAQYEAKCLMCHLPSTAPKPGDSTDQAHTGPSYRTCPVEPARDCVRCHMPRTRVGALHLNLTDHYIRVKRPTGDVEAR